MSPLIDLSPSSPCQEEIIKQYETLRSLVLEKTKSAANNIPGFSALLFRGMTCWMKTCLSSQSNYSPQLKLSNFQEINSSEQKSCVLPYPIHAEAIMILTNIILYHQKEGRNTHV